MHDPLIVGIQFLVPLLAAQPHLPEGGLNHPPVALSANLAFDAWPGFSAFAFNLPAIDQDGDPLTYFIATDAWLPYPGTLYESFTGPRVNVPVSPSVQIPLADAEVFYVPPSPAFAGQVNVLFFARDSHQAISNIGLVTLTVNSPLSDPDGDGLTNQEEYVYHTSPTDPDSDDDQVSDGDEVHFYHTNPLKADTDSDGLNDFYEISRTYATGLSTDANLPDTDGDGLTDYEELTGGHAASGVITDPTNPDTDGDGLPDGIDPDPNDFHDADGDGMSDEWELANGFDPNDPSDADDDPDGDGFTNLQEFQNGTPPNATLYSWPAADQRLAVPVLGEAIVWGFAQYTQHAADSPYATITIRNSSVAAHYAAVDPNYVWMLTDSVAAFDAVRAWYEVNHPNAPGQPDLIKTVISGGLCNAGPAGAAPPWPSAFYPVEGVACGAPPPPALPPEYFYGASGVSNDFVHHKVNVDNTQVRAVYVNKIVQDVYARGAHFLMLDNIAHPSTGGLSYCGLPPSQCPTWTWAEITDYLHDLRSGLNAHGVRLQANVSVNPVVLAQSNNQDLLLLREATDGFSLEAPFYYQVPAAAKIELDVFRNYLAPGNKEVVFFQEHPNWTPAQRRQQGPLYAALLMILREPGQATFTTRNFYEPPSEYEWATWPARFGAPLGPYTMVGAPTSGRFLRQFANGAIYVHLAQITDQMTFNFKFPPLPGVWTLRRPALAVSNLPALVTSIPPSVTYDPPTGTDGPDAFIYGAFCNGAPPSLDCAMLAVFGVRVNAPAPNPLCGNGILEPPEECDNVYGVGANFGTYGDGVGQCAAYSAVYLTGDLICTPQCTISTAGCH
jgi:hypothetical protein